MGNWVEYNNGNYNVRFNLDNGTKIRYNDEDSLIPAFAESIDLNVTNKCDNGCPYCYQGCSPEGEDADWETLKFLDTLHPYTELAINGNQVELGHLGPFLRKMKDKNVIVNLTVSQRHFMLNKSNLHLMQVCKWIHGLGISLEKPTDEFFEKLEEFDNNVVIHTIAGVTTIEDYRALAGRNLKVLVLGYKNKGRGSDWYSSNGRQVEQRIQKLRSELPGMIKRGDFGIISFDNLALDQLRIRELVSDEIWERSYMGDDAQYTFFIDAVARKFGGDSLVAPEKMLPIMDNVDAMFRVVRENKWH